METGNGKNDNLEKSPFKYLKDKIEGICRTLYGPTGREGLVESCHNFEGRIQELEKYRESAHSQKNAVIRTIFYVGIPALLLVAGSFISAFTNHSIVREKVEVVEVLDEKVHGHDVTIENLRTRLQSLHDIQCRIEAKQNKMAKRQEMLREEIINMKEEILTQLKRNGD